MKINSEGIRLLEEILEDSQVDCIKIDKLMKSKSMRGFIEHEKSFNKDISKRMVIEELIKVKKDNEYKDKYGFYILKKDIVILKKELYYMKKNGDKIVDEALDKAYKFMPSNIKIEPSIYLYSGGIDGAFTVYTKEIFINYVKYLNQLEEFIKVISHELFHCRSVSLKAKLKNCFQGDFNINKYIYEILGKTLEEGIALLIQHGGVFTKDDPVGTLTKEKLRMIEEEFEKLNYVLLKIKEGKVDYYLMQTIDIYSIGYYIASFLYNYYGKEILLPWILEYDYRKPIKSYIEATRGESSNLRFTKDVEIWLLNL